MASQLQDPGVYGPEKEDDQSRADLGDGHDRAAGDPSDPRGEGPDSLGRGAGGDPYDQNGEQPNLGPGHDRQSGDSSDPRGGGQDSLGRDALRDAEEGGLYNPGGDRAGGSGPNSQSSLAKAESSPSANTDDDTLGRGYNANDKKRGIADRLKGLGLPRRRTLLLVGVPGGAIAILILFLILLAGSLQLPQVTQNIENYEFARVSRQFAKNAASVTDEELALQATNDSTWSALKTRFTQGYTDVRDSTWGRFDDYRPGQVIKTLSKEKNLQFYYKTSAIRGRKILTKISFNGVDYDIPQVTGVAKWVPGLNSFLRTKNTTQVLAKSDFLSEVNNAMRAKGIATVIRGKVANDIIQATGGSRAGWLLSKFSGVTTEQDALDEASVQMFNATENGTSAGDNAVTEEIKQADADAKSATEQEVSSWSPNSGSNSQLDNTINSGNDDVALAAADSDLNSSLLKTVLGVADPTYAVATPLCIIYDGSVQQSQPSIDNQTNQQENSFDQLAAEADMQKTGDQTPDDSAQLAAAIKGTNAELGNNLVQSIPYQRAAGLAVNTTDIPSAEAGSDGSFDYSLFDSIGISGSSPGGQVANWITGNVCSALTSTATAAGLGLLNLVVGILSFGATDAGEQAAGDGALAFTKAFVGNIVKNLFAKEVVQKGASTIERGALNRAMRFVFKQGVIAGGTFGLAELAHMEVAARAGEANNGLAQGNDLANEADSGGNLEGNKLNQHLTFGRPLNPNEVDQSDQQDKQFVAEQNASKSFADRYLATSNSDSLVSHMAMDLYSQVHTGIFSALAKLASALLKPLSYVGSIFNISGVAQAAPSPDTQHYGNVQFGWTSDEESLINSDGSYKGLENQRVLDAYKGTEAKIAKKYAVCFGYKYNDSGDGQFDPNDPNGDLQPDPSDTMGYLLSQGLITRDSNGSVTNGGLCSPKNLSYNSPDSLADNPYSSNHRYHDLIFRWRLAEGLDATLDQLISEQSVSTGSSTAPSGPTTPPGNFPTGTGKFTTDTSHAPYPGVNQMLARVQAATQSGGAAAFCASIGGCSGKCESAVEMAWLGHRGVYADPFGSAGSTPAAGSAWAAALASGHAHPGDRNPPVGALLIYNSHDPGDPFGHITIYLGNNTVFSTDFDHQGSVGTDPASDIEIGSWANSYVGWMDPYFNGKVGN